MDDLKFFMCSECGNIAFLAVEGGGKLFCCGNAMAPLAENATDAAVSKHVPVIEKSEGIFKIAVGEVTHPMEDKHYIAFIAALTDGKAVFKKFKPGEKPEMETCGGEHMKAYAWCNLHGLWKGEK